MTISRAELRTLIRNKRQALVHNEQLQHAQQLCANVARSPLYKTAKTIAAYTATDGELDPILVVNKSLYMGKRVYLPVLAPLNNQLLFAPWDEKTKMRENRFGIMEPDVHASKMRNARQLDMILLPLVAFDLAGNRLGMGGGYYDRSLAYLLRRKFWRKPVLIGVGHEIQKVEKLKREVWDIPVDAIATEEKVYTF